MFSDQILLHLNLQQEEEYTDYQIVYPQNKRIYLPSLPSVLNRCQKNEVFILFPYILPWHLQLLWPQLFAFFPASNLSAELHANPHFQKHLAIPSIWQVYRILNIQN